PPTPLSHSGLSFTSCSVRRGRYEPFGPGQARLGRAQRTRGPSSGRQRGAGGGTVSRLPARHGSSEYNQRRMPDPASSSPAPKPSSKAPAAQGAGRLAQEVARRRTFAIISHPDAGKTTLTEKLLLYSGAIREAGSVSGRMGGAAATSD